MNKEFRTRSNAETPVGSLTDYLNETRRSTELRMKILLTTTCM
jgi:hypothetical protein